MSAPTTIESTARDITPRPPVSPPATDAKPLPRLTKQQHDFVVAFMRYGIATKAYRLAYAVKDETSEKTVWANASRTLNNNKVGPWIAHLRAQTMHDDLQSVLREFDQNRNGALEVGNYSAANGATRGKAQVLGLIPHDRQNAGSFGNVTIVIVPQDTGLF